MSIYKESDGVNNDLQLRDYDTDFFKRLIVPGDGDCAYHSFLKGMKVLHPEKNVPKTTTQLRRLLLEKISNEDMLPRSLRNGKNKNNLKALIKRLNAGIVDKGSEGSWAENEEMEMLANIYDLCIAIWSKSMGLWVYLHNNSVPDNQTGLSGCEDIVFMYNAGGSPPSKTCGNETSCGCHYDALVPKQNVDRVDNQEVLDMEEDDNTQIDEQKKKELEEMGVTKRFEYFKKQIEMFDESKEFERFIAPTMNLSKAIKPEIKTHRLNQHPELLIDEVNITPGQGFFYTKRQKFLKRFFSVDTKNVAVLLFHDVGVGKTCSSILIAENFINLFEKKVLVFLPSSLESNYRKELFDVTKLDFKNGTYESCSGHRYLKQLPQWTKMNPTEINRKVQQMINDEYSFYGYLKIVNVVEKIKERGRRRYPNDKAMRQQYLFWMVRDLFSDRVIIIDEIHNIRIANDKSLKKFPKILKMILMFSENVRLVLLSATPMFDQPDEFSWIMDFIYTTDKHYRSYDTSIDFEDETLLSESTNKRLAYFARNYVSYMKGYNPKTFPIKYFVSKKSETIPTMDMLTKEPISKTLLFNNQNVEYNFVACSMRPYQKKMYKKNRKESNSDESPDSSESENSRDVQNIIQLSNIVYPEIKDDDFELKHIKGEIGFKKHFKLSDDSSNKGMKVKYSNSDSKNIFDMKNLAKYSSKMYEIVNNIKSSNGLVLVYSKYLFSGVVPIAIALEHLGFSKYNNQNILDEKKTRKSDSSYIILTADERFSRNNTKELNVFNSEENKRGKLIKVALINDIAAEGVTFKNVREIHVLEPWYNMYKIEQIIGRGVRFMSHSALPADERNVGIFLYVNMIDNEETETIDYRRYRKALEKQERIQTVEKVLKENAIDCGIDGTFDNTEEEVEYIDSKGSKRSITLVDQSVECAKAVKKKGALKNPRERMIMFDIMELAKRLRNYITSQKLYKFTRDEIMKSSVVHELLDYALKYFVTKKIPVTLDDVKGYFISPSKDLYVFQPKEIDDVKITLKERSNKPSLYVKRITINSDTSKETSKKKKTTTPSNLVDTTILNKFNEYLSMFENQKNHVVNKEVLMDMAVDHSINDPSIIPSVKNKDIVDALKRGMYILDGEKVFYNIFQKRFHCPSDNSTNYVPCGIKRNQKLTETLIAKINQNIANRERTLGYVELGKNEETITKIKHLNDPTKKSTGSACVTTSTFKVGMLKEYVQANDNTIDVTKFGKKQLCMIYEYTLRKGNMFARPIEHLMKKN